MKITLTKSKINFRSTVSGVKIKDFSIFFPLQLWKIILNITIYKLILDLLTSTIFEASKLCNVLSTSFTVHICNSSCIATDFDGLCTTKNKPRCHFSFAVHFNCSFHFTSNAGWKFSENVSLNLSYQFLLLQKKNRIEISPKIDKNFWILNLTAKNGIV